VARIFYGIYSPIFASRRLWASQLLLIWKPDAAIFAFGPLFMPKLTIKLPGVGEVAHELVDTVVTIGRFQGNTIQIKDSSVSGSHAEMAVIPNGYRIKDLDSTNKTFVNGVAIKELEVRGSAHVRFGTVDCFLEQNANTQQPASELDAAKIQIESLLMARDALHNHNQELVRQRDTAREKMRDLSERITQLEGDLQKTTATANSEEAEKKIGEMETRLHSLQAECDAARKETQSRETELSEAKKKLEELDSVRANSEASGSDIRQQLEKALQQIEALKAAQEEATRKEAALTEQLAW